MTSPIFSDFTLLAMLRLGLRRERGATINTLGQSIRHISTDHLAFAIERGWIKRYRNGNRVDSIMYAITEAGETQIRHLCDLVNKQPLPTDAPSHHA